MSEFHRIVYVSRARDGLNECDIEAILDQSTSNNYERFITGFLTYNHGRFMQVIEGPAEEVVDIYGRIESDDRHNCVVQVIGEPAERRIFPDWSMNYFRVDGDGGSPKMLVKSDEVDDLMPADAPKPYLYLFSRFMALR
ncbi:MAG: BLUF domain-containing protein [Pseudomonadota bacterium]